ncbi:putative bifunctional diguanylate cyclase/phosphodiesterase [Deinococcus radiophilus]|uniref:EAL domain-containing protein n=1 Tax=Deinococcus radiophilus TaxID=32062 RepID=A0A431VTY6_9DEIO|nr:EAL domain-containing protein [Deinococcus radiophilus]RTR26676.1 EAL domain-containing protein [Deinococcus radiophilus]UFA50994.1 EAL domain-containing protein [Deinococcus radiophilus]
MSVLPPAEDILSTTLEAEGPEWQSGWITSLTQGSLTILAATVSIWFLETGDAWDVTYDRALNLIMIAGLVLTILMTQTDWRQKQNIIELFLRGSVVWLLVQLGLLLFTLQPIQTVQRELTETLIWFPTVLVWTLLATGSLRSLQPVLYATLIGLMVVMVLGGSYWTYHLGWNNSLVANLLQLLISSLTAFLMLRFSLQRLERLKFAQGERQALAALAYRDLLTELPNRLALERELSDMTRPGATPFSLLVIDVDSFKVINDTLGHAAGDQVLRGVAQALMRGEQRGARAFRISGDEFVVLAPGFGTEHAEALARSFQRDLTEHPDQDVGVRVGLSVGISRFPDDGQTPQALLRHADSAMYSVKRSGRGRVKAYREDQDLQTERFQQLARVLGQSRQPGEEGFYLKYQPIFNLLTGKIAKVEALLRWQHAEMGLIVPQEFIRVAEQTGQLPHLGLWALERACREALAWPITLSVNVSATQLCQPDFAVDVASILSRTGFPSERLELELTETAQLYENDRVQVNLSELCSQGVSLSIDDFGAGYSNLARLRSMQLTGIKLDRSLIQDLPAEDEFSHLVSEAVLDLSYLYSLDLTAEGLETQEHVDAVCAMGFELGQGFALSRPLSAEALTDQLRANAATQPRNLCAGNFGADTASEPLPAPLRAVISRGAASRLPEKR